jgi:hypothetical protein
MVVRTRAEIQAALQDQLKMIAASCGAYDKGEKWEAPRLASSVYVVVHDRGKRDRSLLTQLGLKDQLRFVSSGHPSNPRNVLAESPLIITRVWSDGRAEYLPRLDGSPKRLRALSFSEWWENELIYRRGQYQMTRKNLAFSLRSREGGAHFDPELTDPAYIHMAREHATTPAVTDLAGNTKAVLGAEQASMRQIAWELMQTLKAIEPGLSAALG